MKKYSLVLLIVIVGILTISGCQETDVAKSFDTNEQFLADSAAIAAYINRVGLDPAKLDTTDNYFIYTVLDYGTGDSLEYDDIVSINYNVFDPATDSAKITNIPALALAFNLADTVVTEGFQPIKFTYTASTWTAPGVWPLLNTTTDDPRNTQFREAIIKSFQGMKVGGKVLMISPSLDLLIQSSGYLNEIRGVEVYPVQVRKHLE